MMRRDTLSSACMAAAALATSAQADFYQFVGVLDNGYSVAGILETKASAPAAFVESNPSPPNAPFATQYLESASLNVSRFGATLGAGLPIAGGISIDPYLYVGFDAMTPGVSALDLNTRAPNAGLAPYYFISNGVLPDYTSVAYGTTAFNLFLFDPANSTATFLASTSTIVVTQIPAPAGILALVLLPIARGRRR